MNTDVQIYVTKLRKYITESTKARELFLSGQIDLDDFIDEVTKISIINVDEGRDPQLTKDQYESVRKSLSSQVEPYIQIIDNFPPFFLN